MNLKLSKLITTFTFASLFSLATLADTNLPISLSSGAVQTLPSVPGITYVVTCGATTPPPAPIFTMAVIRGVTAYGWYNFCAVGIDQISAQALARRSCREMSAPNQREYCEASANFSETSDKNACESANHY